MLYIEKRKPKQHMIFLQYHKHHIVLLQNIIIIIFDKLSQHPLYIGNLILITTHQYTRPKKKKNKFVDNVIAKYEKKNYLVFYQDCLMY